MYEVIVDKLVWPLLLAVLIGIGGLTWAWLSKKARRRREAETTESQQTESGSNKPVQVDEETRIRIKLSALWEDQPSQDVQEKAVEILKRANNETANGRVAYMPHMNGFTVKIGNMSFKGGLGYEQQVWKEAIDLLVDGDYLEHKSENLSVLTSKGYIEVLIDRQPEPDDPSHGYIPSREADSLANEIRDAAAQAGGRIHLVELDFGLVVKVGQEHFGMRDGHSQAELREAIDVLVARGFLRRIDDEVYALTTKGYAGHTEEPSD